MSRTDSRTYVLDCAICRRGAELYERMGTDYAVMKDHPACQKCGVLIGPAHATKIGPICPSCVGMPGPASTVAESLKMAAKARLSLRAYHVRAGGFER